MIDEFVSARRERWERLERLIGSLRGGAHRRPAEELEELGRLYRQATSDLAIARRDFPRDRVTRYLEQLVARAHPVLYRRGSADWSAIGRFVAVDFPRAFRAAWPYTVAAALLLLVPFSAAFVATRADPLTGRIFLSAGAFVEQVEEGESWLEIEEGERGLAASFIMTNNIRVSLLALGGGVLFGAGTVYVLIFNGLSLGAVSGLAGSYGLGDDLLNFVAAHGGLELTVVFLAGGAGLRLGHALLAPGLLTRRAALVRAARHAVPLLFGCVPLLIIAGLLEGFVSPSDMPGLLKLAIGVTATILLYIYALGAGRERAVRARAAP